MTVYKLAWKYLRAHAWELALILFLQVLQVLLNLTLPALNARVIDVGILQDDAGYIWKIGGIMIAFIVVQALCSATAIFFGSRISTRMGRDLRRDTFRHVQRFSPADQRRFGASTLVTRTTNDVMGIQMVALFTFTLVVTAPIMGIGGIIMAIGQDVTLSATLLVIVPLLALIILLCMVALAKRYRIVQKRVDAINDALRAQLTGVRVIRAFRRQNYTAKRFDESNAALRKIYLEVGTIWSGLMPLMSAVIGIASAVIVWLAGHRIEAGLMPVGALTAFINYLMMILGAVLMIGMIIMIVPRGNVSARRIKEILDTEPSISSPASPRPLPAGPLTFSLCDAALTYDDAEEPSFYGVNLDFAPGTTTAIVGASGCGKSSLVKILPRLADLTTGTYQVNGVDVHKLDLAAFRQRIAYVPQRAFLFSGTIATNVTGNSKDIDEARVRKALEVAQALDFVEEQGGIHARVESGGKNLSGGQRQRVTIARALYRALPDADGKPGADLIVFDDSFSALDFATDARLRQALREEAAGSAVVIVAQRTSTTRSADTILVLADGHPAGLGSHAELMRDCKTYQEIVKSQEHDETAEQRKETL
ncbi:ABC transporter ATP-binding protein [Actinobaculum suis]|uniref:ABC transporter ATP-binding protein n=1 Tax=Actinobaculum suis TaxID=1657 RepID=UPI00066FFEEA|nr:ABC transporter ATP-binding protein [Actinobaculum suis]KMY22898.1 ABC transporter [Actinobaculum suis]OCA93948.1 ABC transporter [Actinobaculum suis]OCA94413.1 ABC transporter [Actinobaculum suis]